MVIYFRVLMIPEGFCQADERWWGGGGGGREKEGGKGGCFNFSVPVPIRALGAWKALEAGHPTGQPAQMRLIWPEWGPVPSHQGQVLHAPGESQA